MGRFCHYQEYSGHIIAYHYYYIYIIYDFYVIKKNINIYIINIYKESNTVLCQSIVSGSDFFIAQCPSAFF